MRFPFSALVKHGHRVSFPLGCVSEPDRHIFDSYYQFRPVLAVVEIRQAALSYREGYATYDEAYQPS